MVSNDFHGGSLSILYSKDDCERKSDLFHLQLFYMKLVGQVPVNLELYVGRSWKLSAKLLSHSYSASSVFFTLHLALLFMKTTYDKLQEGQLEEISDALTMAIIYLFACYAIVYWLYKGKSLGEFLARINEFHRHHSMAGLTFVNVSKSYSLAYKITLYWLRCCMTGVVFWAINPLLLRSYTLPLKCWYPFNPLQPVYYELTYISQVWCQFVMGCIFGNGSALFVSIIITMLGQFDVLFCSLKNLDFHARLLSGEDLNLLKKLQSELLVNGDDELNQYVYSKEHLTDLNVFAPHYSHYEKPLRIALHESLVECVRLHRFILESCDTLEELFNPYCLFKSLQITLQLCLLVFVGVAGESSMMRAINLLQYLALTLFELFMFTYFGELLRGHSIRAGEAFFRSQWWPNANHIKRDVFIFLINTKRVVKVTAGKFYTMDVQRLRSVITQAFSFLTLLQNLAEKSN